MYTIVGTPRSRSIRVIWLMEEMGLAYKSLPYAPRSEEALAISTSGKVPVLIDDGVKISDSVAIMTYLADKHGKLTFPSGTIERAIQDSHTNFILEEFDAILWSAVKHKFALPKEHRIAKVRDSLNWEFGQSQKRFVDRLGDGPFLMGDQMTIADILAVHCGRWAKNTEFPVNEPVFLDYISRMTKRPAFIRALGEV